MHTPERTLCHFTARGLLPCALTHKRRASAIKYWTPHEVLRRPPQELPRHLLVLGGGAVGCELAQAFARLGSRVTIVAPSILPRESLRAQRAAADVLVNSTGIRWVQGRGREVLRRMPGEVTLLLEGQGHVVGSHLLVATGRKPRAGGMGLCEAGVRYTNEGIYVDHLQRTSVPHIRAVGDCCCPFTADGGVQVGGYDGGFVEGEGGAMPPQGARKRRANDRRSHHASWQAYVATQSALLPWLVAPCSGSMARPAASASCVTRP